MKHVINAYIDTYTDITVIAEKKGKYKPKSFYLYDDEEMLEELKISYISTESNCIKIGLINKTRLHFHHNYTIIDNLNHVIPLYSGSVVRTTEFESEFFYDGPLGFEYSNTSTIFRVWSPVAKSIFIELKYKDQHFENRELTYKKHGVWEVEIAGDLDGVAYAYYVKLFEDYQKVNDPYGISSSANGEYNYVVNKDHFYKMKYQKPVFSGKYTDAVLYEASIRDLTCQLKNSKKGTFLGIVDEEPDKGLNYISSLGVTHLQLMPVFDFGGIDAVHKDKLYNWGYNPEQYFIPCGWYSLHPEDPYSRINELLELIDQAHYRGLRVVMDVVFNHVYRMKSFPFEQLVPGYFFRVDQYGNYTNTSGCGNDIATEKRMCSRFIVDNLKYWASVYHISGFRFDLMGLLDIETLNIAYDELKAIDPDMMVYGEGWNMPNTIPDAFRPHSYNHYKMPHYAFFNDRYRDTLKGSQWNQTPGFVFGGKGLIDDTYHLVAGSCINHFKFQNPNQTINYVECHDNYTAFDYATKVLKQTEEQAIAGARLALQLVIISLGVVFIHAGQEFYRTKKGTENSYNSPDKINLFDYQRKEQYSEDIEGFKELLEIRKEHEVFHLSNIYEIEKCMHPVENLCLDDRIVYCLDGTDYIMTIVIKNSDDEQDFKINGTMIFNGYRRCNQKEDAYLLKNRGVYLFKEVK